MSINVYWACLEDEWMRDSEPEPISNIFYSSKKINEPKNKNLMLSKCPFFNNNFKNIYQVRSLYSYSFRIQNGLIKSDTYDQKFFDDHVIIRSIEKRAFSFVQKRIFFADSNKGLEMTAYEFPYLENNNITKRTIPLVGTFDISKWFRNIEYPFYLKDDHDEFIVNEKEVMFYLRFNTKEKINFKQFYATERIKEFANSGITTFNHSSLKHSMNDFYNNFKIKNIVKKEIKRNLL